MTIEERGRRAADELHRSVSAHLDVDRALDQVVGTGTPTGAARVRTAGPAWQRPAFAVAAVLIMCIGITVAVVIQNDPDRPRRGGDESAQEQDVESLLPASAIDGKESMALPVAISPQTGLVDGSEVEVAGSGFEAGELVGVVICGSEAYTQAAGIDACQVGQGFSGVLATVSANTDGVVRTTVVVPQVIQSEGRGQIDCTEVAERCMLALAASTNYDRSGGAFLYFEGSPPFAEVELTATPVTDLTAGQEVLVSATGLVPGRYYGVLQCRGDRCVHRKQLLGALDGSASALIAAYPTLVDADGEVICDDGCVFRLDGRRSEGITSAPFGGPIALSFAPPGAADPSTVSSPAATTAPEPQTATTAPEAQTTTSVAGSPDDSVVATAPVESETTVVDTQVPTTTTP